MVVSVDLSVFGLEAGVAIIATEAFIVSFSAYTKIRINIVRRKGNGAKKNEIRQKRQSDVAVLRDIGVEDCGVGAG